MIKLAVFFLISIHAYSKNEHPPLDHHFKPSRPLGIQTGSSDEFDFPSKSDLLFMLNIQSSVKSQGSRNTCSIFSSTALVESILNRDLGLNSADYSEEWLQYLNMSTQVYPPITESSSSWNNFRLMRIFGMPTEKKMPYDYSSWGSRSTQTRNRCGRARGDDLKKCIYGHYPASWLWDEDRKISDLDFKVAKEDAAQWKQEINTEYSFEAFSFVDEVEVKKQLLHHQPVTVDLQFFYGAWNHGGGNALGIPTNGDHWDQGLVFYPPKDSMDEINSPHDPAGHSILILGYDDQKIITKKVKMKDGSWKEFQTKGGYYFKNSWGKSFGSEMSIEGIQAPGFGFISYDYAHRYGIFQTFLLKRN